MALFTLDELEAGAKLVYAQTPPTPQYLWPQIAEAAGAAIWLKHENHTQIGAFKSRGAITFIDWLRRAHPEARGVATATRGNHGQAQARAATLAGLQAKIVVPLGNSTEKNAAMRAFGAELIEHGADFDESRIEAARIAEKENLFLTPPFHREIVRGVASYALELFAAVPDLDAVYAPIGCGSGLCSIITARDVLGLKTKVIGVVSSEAAGAKLSFEAGRIIETTSARTFADGMAVRAPIPEAFEIYQKGAERIVAVTEDEIAEAARMIYRMTHNAAEGAGAAALAAALQDRDRIAGKKVAAILSGGNIDAPAFAEILRGETPAA